MIKVKHWNLRTEYAQKIPSNSYLTHSIHAYTAKLIPQIPRYFIERYTEKDDTILDLFCGSGTTLLESILLSRNGIGIDINPLAVLISKVKTKQIDTDKLSFAISLVKEELLNSTRKAIVYFPNIDYWFSSEVQNDLSRIKYIIENLSAKDGFSESIKDFLLVCLSSIIRKSSYADPRMAKTYKSKRVIKKVEKGWVPTPIQYFNDALDRNSERIKGLSEHVNHNSNHVRLFQGDSRETVSILRKNDIREVDSIITSPPYINAQDYFRSYKLELWWLGLATPEEVVRLKRQTIGTENTCEIDHRSMLKNEIPLLKKTSNAISGKNRIKSAIVNKYFENMKLVFKQCSNILKKGGYFCLITGNNNICGIQVPTCDILGQTVESIGFKMVEKGRDIIKDRALPPRRNHDGGIIKEEWITVFEKRS